MARKKTRKDLRKVIKRLSDDDITRLYAHAEKLAEGGRSTTGAESLSKDGRPSYLALADESSYKRQKKEIERGHRPDPR